MESGSISHATKAKLVNPVSQAKQTSGVRSGIAYNQVVKANIICNIVDAATGFSDGVGTDTMAKDIDDKIANPGELKVITASPKSMTDDSSQNPEIHHEVEKMTNIFSWVIEAPDEVKNKFIELTRNFCSSIETIQNHHSTLTQERLPF